jgi:hypothetical protein
LKKNDNLPDLKSEDQLIGLEIPSSVPFEVDPEYASMVSKILEPNQSTHISHSFPQKSLKPSDLIHSQLQQNEMTDPYFKEYYNNGDLNLENDFGQVNYMDIREYLKSYARDPDHLSQMLIEQKMGRLDMMDKISEEHSMDLDNSIITHGVNKSMIFKDPKLLHSDSWWLGPRPGVSNANVPGRAFLNTSNHLSRDMNSSFRLITSQGELGSSRNDDLNLSGFLLRNSSFKHNKFPLKRKVSLKVDEKEGQETQFFHIPENKNKSSNKISSPIISDELARLKTVRNSDITARRGRDHDIKTHSRSLNNSGVHSMTKKTKANYEEFNFKEYSLSKEFDASGSILSMHLKNKLPPLQIKSNRPSIDQNQTSNLEDVKVQKGKDFEKPLDVKIPEKGNSEEFLESSDFQFSCVQLNESKENTIIMDNITNNFNPFKGDSMIQYNPKTNRENQFKLQIENDFNSESEKIKKKKEKIEEKKSDTVESWMNYPSSNIHMISEVMRIPRKISDIPIVDSSKRGSLILFGGEFTPGHKRSEVLEKNFGKETHSGSKEDNSKQNPKEPKQNITDLMKKIIKKTQGLATVKEVSIIPNEGSINGISERSVNNLGNKRENINSQNRFKDMSSDKINNDELNSSSQFESCLSNMQSMVNIESTTNLHTMFDIDFDPNKIGESEKFIQKIRKRTKSREKTFPVEESMLSDENNLSNEIFRVVSQSDNDYGSVDHNNEILLMTNKEIAKKTSTGQWVDQSMKKSGSNVESNVTLESVISNLDSKTKISWERGHLLPPSQPGCFKKPARTILPKEKFQEILEAKSCKKQQFKSSKLGLKITRMSRKAAKNDTLKMRSPKTLSITNHTDISDQRAGSPICMKKSRVKQKTLKDKLWESLVSSKKNKSIDTGSKFEKTLGSLSIQSLMKKPKEQSLTRISRRNLKSKNSFKDHHLPWKSKKLRYQSGNLNQTQTIEVNLLKDKIGMMSLVGGKGEKETHSTSRIMRSSQHGSNSIYSKASQHESIPKEMKRSSIMNKSQGESKVNDMQSEMVVEDKKSCLVSKDISQREINVDILRYRNTKEVQNKFQNIYKPKIKTNQEDQANDNSEDSQKRKKLSENEISFSKKGIGNSKQEKSKYCLSGGLESQGRESDNSSLFHVNKRSGNDSGFLPFPRSIKIREESTHKSKLSDPLNNQNLGLKDYYSGNQADYILNQKDEYGILSGKGEDLG